MKCVFVCVRVVCMCASVCVSASLCVCTSAHSYIICFVLVCVGSDAVHIIYILCIICVNIDGYFLYIRGYL